MDIQQRLLKFVTWSNWLLLAVASLLSLALAPVDFTKGVICGGLIVTVGFHMLYRTLKKSFTGQYPASFSVVFAKYYLRLLVTAVIIFVLISQKLVNPLGLLVGLSIVVTSILAATVRESTRLLTGSAEIKTDLSNYLGKFLFYGGLVFVMTTAIFGGLLVGWLLDQKVFGTSPWLTIVFLLAGVVVAFVAIGKAIKRARMPEQSSSQ